LSQELPQVNVSPEAVEEVFIAVSALVVGLALQFNHNRYKWDAMQAESATAAHAGLGGAGPLEVGPLAGVGVEEEAADLEEPDALLDDNLDDDDIDADDDVLDEDERELYDEAAEPDDDLLEDEEEEDEEELLRADTDRIVHGSAGVEEGLPAPPARART
jgi:hypothetical protein